MRIAALVILTLAVAAAGARCSELVRVPLGLDAYLPTPDDDPLTAAKIELGRKLFFDKRLSRGGSLSCSNCHDPRHSFRDARQISVGVFDRKGTRRVPTLVNRVYGKSFFWDGRTTTLEQQVMQPIANPHEMDMPLGEAASRVGLSQQAVSQALASYVRTILSGDSPYDRYVAGDQSALSPEARRGLEIFRGKGNCATCHMGANLTDESFHNTGIAWRDGRETDVGRFLVTHREQDRGAFKTPTLRQIAAMAPYMHDGSKATLQDVIEYYDRGGNHAPHLDPEIHPLHLTAEDKTALLELLRSFTGIVREGAGTAGPRRLE
ncbi:MAG: cytochrome-c peroxidase [Bryobacteraceae bacterium]